MANKHLKTLLELLVIRESQIKMGYQTYIEIFPNIKEKQLIPACPVLWVWSPEPQHDITKTNEVLHWQVVGVCEEGENMTHL
jgi:hypothetical protein